MTPGWSLSTVLRTKIRLIIFFAAKDGETLYSQEKQDRELTVAQIMWLRTPVVSPGESHGQRSLADYSPWSFSRADRGIGGVRQLAPPTWLVSNFLVLAADQVPEADGAEGHEAEVERVQVAPALGGR